MNIKESMRLMKLGMKADVPYLLVGHSGIGKTQITEQIAKEVFPNHEFVTVVGSVQDAGDFAGIPSSITLEQLLGESKKKVQRVTSWARPEWMPVDKPCIIFLDELNNAPQDVESALLKLVLEKKIHTHSLHPDSYICAAINPATAEYTTANVMSSALVKRFMVIPFEPQNEEFLEWAESSKRIHPDLVKFFKFRPDLTGTEKKLETTLHMEPCPRMLEMLSKLYTVIDKEGSKNDRNLLSNLFMSTLGVQVAGTFLSWLDSQEKPLSFDEVISDPKVAFKKYDKFVKESQTDLVNSSIENILNGFYQIHEDVIDRISYKTSILEEDRSSDQNLIKKAREEFNDNIKNNLGENKQKLDNLITFLDKLPIDVFHQITNNIITHKPFIDNATNEDQQVYHKKQIKRFEAYNTLCFYLYRDDIVTLKGHKGLFDKFIAGVNEINKNKKKVNE